MRIVYFLLLFTVANSFSQSLQKHELLVPYRDGKLWGLCDTLGKVKVKPFAANMEKFAIAPDFKGSYVIRKGRIVTIIDQYKKTLFNGTDLDSVQLSNFSDNIKVYKNQKVGLLKRFQYFIPIGYDAIAEVGNASFEVTKAKKVGLINSKGKEVIPVAYSYIGWPREGNADPAKFDWVAFLGYDQETIYTDDRIPVAASSNRGGDMLVNRQITKEEYEREQNNYKRIRRAYGEITAVSNDMVVVKNENHYRVYAISKDSILLENDGSIEIFPSHHGVQTFLVQKNGLFGLVDATGKLLLDYRYDKITYRLNGVCFLEKDTKKGLFILNSIYKPVEPEYRRIKILEPVSVNDHWQFGLFEVTTMEGKKGLLGENGTAYFRD